MTFTQAGKQELDLERAKKEARLRRAIQYMRDNPGDRRFAELYLVVSREVQ